MLSVYWFAIGALFVWRVTHLLAAEDGPGDLLLRLRRRLGQGWLGRLLDCFYCLSLWTAAPVTFMLSDSRLEQILLWPALSGAAILLERVSADPEPSVIAYPLDEEENAPCPVVETAADNTPDRAA